MDYQLLNYFIEGAVDLIIEFGDKDIVICRFPNVCLFISMLCFALPTKAVHVITHTSVNVQHLNSQQLKRIYLIRQLRWGNNLPIVVFVLPSQHSTHKKFTTTMLNAFPYKLDRIWNKLTFSGLGVAPILVRSEKELINAVRTTPGAIGYVDNIIKDEHVNVITVAK